MKNRYFLKGISLICSVMLMISIFYGCGKSETSDKKELSGTLTIWSWNDELAVSGMIEDFEKAYPDINVNLVVVPDTDNSYYNKLLATLKSGVNAPDVFLIEAQYLEILKNIKAYENLSQEPYNAEELKNNMVDYTVDAARDEDGNITALTWQVTSGGYFYRRSLAKKYLGTDNVDDIQAMLTNNGDFIKLSETLKEKSNGKVSFLASSSELINVIKASRKEPWVKDNKLIIDPVMEDYLDIAKEYKSKNLTNNLQRWTEEWAKSMEDGSVFGFVLPTWGISSIIPGNASSTKGDWGFIKTPLPYFWGGSWLAMYKGSNNKEIGWEFIKFITSNEEFLENYAERSGDFLNNKNVQKKIATSDKVSNSFLNGQNPYKTYIEIADTIDISTFTEYDDKIDGIWIDVMGEYADGQITKEQAISEFKNKVKAECPELQV